MNMAFLGRINLVFFLVMSALYVPSMAAVYEVGDTIGWTTIGSPDYDKWAASKTFHIGDTVRFVYHADRHNVVQVLAPDYESCNGSNPLITYQTGNDSIPIKKGGHYYFLCSIPGHCDKGQKVDIQVTPGAASAPSDVSPITDNSTTTTTDHKSCASFPSKGLLRNLLAAMALFVHASFVYWH